MQRLTAPIPRPRVHFLAFHDVLAPDAKTRAQAVQSVPAERAEALQMAVCEPNCVYLRTVRIRRVQLFKRVTEVDLEHCANCGGELKMRRLRVRSQYCSVIVNCKLVADDWDSAVAGPCIEACSRLAPVWAISGHDKHRGSCAA